MVSSVSICSTASGTEICIELNKSESNITSQRSHIRKKLNMDRKDDLRRELEKRFYEA